MTAVYRLVDGAGQDEEEHAERDRHKYCGAIGHPSQSALHRAPPPKNASRNASPSTGNALV